MIDKMFEVINQKMDSLLAEGKHPAVVLINSSLFKSLQEELIKKDMMQSFGKVRSPHNLKLYRGVQIIPCDTITAADVF